ncbi:hypothetical protein GUA87_05925 [Sneathiella sp. P13V-1]|uniref:diacylglycerol/lipid kinase family protein n=1 Tax=Sneathiella sp. P13V-1 TaxID=2697366 RepID=UPI00187B966D|nr:diacylglycerol kinase family protein [Sneathiella sp. P13V-1]MBE7636375.1 hypothetical protein [Sneathiella sp. P13V-1]
MTRRSNLLVIHNPASGAKNERRFAKAVNLLVSQGCSLDIKKTTGPGHAEELAHFAGKQPDAPEAVIVAGGDGTLAEVAQGLRGSDLPMGVIPLGTANVFAQEIGVANNYRKVAEVIQKGRQVQIYPGYADGRRFLLMIGCGYDSHAVAALNPLEKKKWGAAAYLFAALRVRRQFKNFQVQLDHDGKIHTGASIIVSRAKHYGGPFNAFPKADLEQRAFEILIMNNAGFWAATKYGLGLLLGSIESFGADRMTVTGSLRLTSDFPSNFQMDGDGFEKKVVEIELDTLPLQILKP